MADAVLVPNPNGGMPLLAYPVSVTNSDGTVLTGLAFANIIVAIPATVNGTTDFSLPGNAVIGAIQ